MVMVSFFNKLCDSGSIPFEAVLNGALVRLRTVLMTTLLAMLGLLPMALSHGIGSETQKPLAVVIIGGVFSGAVVEVVFVSAVFFFFFGGCVGEVFFLCGRQ